MIFFGRYHFPVSNIQVENVEQALGSILAAQHY